MEDELKEFEVSEDTLSEVNDGVNIKMLGQMVDARRGALLILQNAFLYPKEGK